MNERIQELFKRAGGKTSVRNLMSNPVQFVETHELWDDRIEKFAELIVRECVEVINAGKNVWTGTDVPAGVALDLAGKNVKAYFGVEE